MANYRDNTGLAAAPATAAGPDAAPFPAAKKFSPPVPSQSLLADMCRNTGSSPSTRLSVVESKPPAEASQPVYSAAFSLADAAAPGTLPAGFDSVGHRRLSVAQTEKTPVPASQREKTAEAPGRPKPQAPPAQKTADNGCVLIPCAGPENAAATFPQTEALSTVLTGQTLSFGEALFSENTVIRHEADTDIFCADSTGVYELCYSLHYEVPDPCVLLVGFEGFPQSCFKQQITQAPARGKLRATVRLLLGAGTALRLALLGDPALPTAQSALISNAALEVKRLCRLDINSPFYSSERPEANFWSENSFLPLVRAYNPPT